VFIPSTLDASDLAKSATGNPATLRFTIDGVSFKPYFESCERNSVYLHVTMKEGPAGYDKE